MASMTRLVLVRHAVTDHTGHSLSGRLPGINLNERGREQAEAVGARLASAPIAAVYASPIERTMQTAQAIAARHADLVVRPVEGVIEAEYGDWSNEKLSDLVTSDLWKVVQRTPSRMRFPNGESIVEVQQRMVGALEALVAQHPEDTIVVVSHSDPIQLAIAHYTGVPLDLYQRIAVSPASVSVLDVGTNSVLMVTSNDTGNLDALLTPHTGHEGQHPGDQVARSTDGDGASATRKPAGVGGSPKGADEPGRSSEPASATRKHG